MSKVYLKYLLMILFVVPLLGIGFSANAQEDTEPPCIGCDPNNQDDPFDPTAGVSCQVITMGAGSITVNTDNGSNTYTHQGTDWDITANDNVGIATISYMVSGATTTVTGSNTSLDGQSFEIGSTIVTWTVVDVNGLSSECSFYVTVVDNEPPCIGCDPSSFDPSDPTAGVSCDNIAGAGTIEVTPDLGASTYTHNGNDWDITATDNVQVASITYEVSGNYNTTLTAPNTTLNGQIFGLGTTTVTWTVMDESGNISNCSFMVNVTDNEPPVIDGANFDRELTSSSCSFIIPDLTEEIRAVSSDNITANSDLVITQDLSAGYQITTTTMVTVTVRDQSGNETSTTVVLSIPNTPTIMVNSRDVVCQGEMAEATVAVTGGTAPYAYNWSDGTTGATATIGAGNYIVTVTDSNGCSAEYSFTVIEPEAFEASITSTQIQCYGASTGSATVTVMGGTAPYTYNWGTISSQESTVTGLAAGTYSVAITDANGCNVTQSVTIDQPAMLDVYVTPSTTTICSGSSANITATAMGGNPSYMYLWSDGSTTSAIEVTPFSTTNYSLTVTDANGCTANQIVTVEVSSPLDVMVNSSDLACNGGTTEATVVVNGGAEPYIYSWSNGTMGSTATIGAGNYIVTVTDSNGCSAEYSFAVTEPEVFAASITSTSIQCYGESTGSATVTVTGGTAPYTYNWGTISSQESTVTGLAAGTYSIAITDANGCNVNQSVTIDQPAMLDVSVTTSATTICSGSSANITATAMGGNPSYMYLWSDGSTTSAIEATPSSTTNYSLTVTDANGCTAMQSVTVEVSAPLDVMVNSSDLACNGGTTEATVVVNGGAEPYIYSWSNGTMGATATIGAGYYIITVTDSNGCSAEYSFTVTEPEVFAASITSTSIQCFGESTGSATVTVTGGTAPYTYNWGTISSQESTVTGLAAGTYSIAITDANGCNVNQSVTIDQPAMLDVSVTTSATTICSGSSANITATAMGGNPSYMYLWSDGSTTSAIEATPFSTTNYSLTVTDANGCTAMQSVTVEVTAPLDVMVNSSDLACNGGTTEATVVVNGGAEPYIYSWSNGTMGATATIGAGYYIVTVTDSYGCSAEYSFTVAEPDLLVLSLSTDSLSSSNPTANINATVIGGNAPYSYQWSNGSVESSIQVYEAGAYSVTVVDSNGCSATESVTINSEIDNESPCIGCDPNGIDPFDPTSGISCSTILNTHLSTDDEASTYTHNGSDWDITANDNTGIASISYSLSGATNAITGSNTTLDGQIFELGSTTVTWTVVDLYGNYSDCSFTVTVVDNESPCIGCDPDPNTPENEGVSCTDIAVAGTIEVTPDLGASTYTHNGNDWDITATDNVQVASITYSVSGNDNTTLTAPNTTLNGQVFGLGTTTVTWTVMDDSGNVSTCSFMVNVTDNEPPAITGNNFDRELTSSSCSFVVPDLTEEIRAVSSDNTTANSDLVITQDISAGSQITTTTMVTVTVRDQYGNETSTTVVLAIPNTPTIMVNSRDVVCQGEMAEATVAVTGGTAPYAYNWSDGTTGATANIMVGSYVVSVTDSNGCSAESSLSVIESEMPVLSLSADATELTCSTQMSNITATVAGGTAPYIYTWSDNSTSNTIVAYNAGVYNVNVTDANGCSAMQTIMITEDVDAPMLSIVNNSNTTTLGCSNTEINLMATGGNAYAWSNGVSTAENIITAAGTYYVTATGANGCTAYEAISITEVPALTIAVNSSNVVCHGEMAEATVVVNGGTAPYTYNWNNGITTPNANLGAGNYIVTVTDSNGCTATYDFTVTEPDMLVLSLSADATVLTCANSTANITAAVAGGTVPYIYTWSDNSTSNTIVAYNAGVYNVNVTDANGCSAMQSITITEDVNVPMLSIVNNSNTTTLGCSNTEINLVATGGTVYAWSNGVSTAENVITAAGTYYVTATGANGCTAYEAITITEVPALTIAVNSSNVVCHGETTDAMVVVNGGTEPYVYNWNNGMTTPNVNLGAGEYIVTVSDASGCTATAQISVVEPEALVVNLTAGTITCAEPTVTITATTIGGTAPYSYMWSDGSVANAIEVYADGVYMVTVVDANGCSAVANVDVESTMGITANVSVVNAQNSDIANGAANVAVVGGVAPYRVVMSQETASYEYVFVENNFVISNLPAATYSLAITDANGCVANVNFVIENICNVSIAEQVTDNGTMLHFENVLYPVTVYVDGNTNGTATEDGYMLQNVENGVHNVFVADANGCFANISVFVEGINCDNVNLMANVSVTPTTSTTNPNGSAVVTAEGGQAPYSFSWSNGNIGDNATDLYQGIYTVVVTDANGCVGTTSFEITYNVPEEEFDELYVTLDYHLEMEQTYTDDGISVIPVAVVYAQAFGGSAPYDYSWMAAGADNGCYFKMYESGSVCVEVRDEQNNAVSGCIFVDVPVTEEISNEIVEEVSQAVDSCFDARFVKAQVLEYAIDTVSGDCVVTWELFDVNGNVHNIDVAYPLDSALSGIYAFNLYFTCNGGRLVTSFSVRLYIEVEGGDPVSVEEIVVSSANAYPNPFTDIINVEIESAVSEDAEISVVNLNGQVVYMTNKHLSAGQNSFEINADNYVPGVYFIRINGSEINETLKMVK